jgi:shikimate dehydrogenase
VERIYGLLGRKLGHSWSVPIHAALGCGDYRLIELEPDALAPFLSREELGGLNVTIPYKKAVIPLCDALSPEAAAIGAVNALVRREDGSLYGDNTDAAGFRFLAQRAGADFAAARVVILGSGGASAMARHVAARAGASEVTVISRTGADNYENLSRHADADIVVNTTPVGMYPHTGVSPVDLRAFPRCRCVLDLIYNPRRTALLLQAQALGIPCLDGLPMLAAQAAAAEELFFSRPVPAGAVERILRQLRREKANLVLIGMPGCGKTTVGRALAEKTGRRAVDLDEEIVRAAGRSIPELFARLGEAGFRALEREQIARWGRESGLILMTGGGAVETPDNYAALRQNGYICALRRDLGALPTDGRPLSQSTGPAALYARRAPLYARFADAFADNSGTPAHTADYVWEDFYAHSGD